MPWYDSYITKTPGVCGGDACIKGTRLAVYIMMNYLEMEGSVQKVLDIFGYLTRAQMDAVIAYAKDHKDEIAECNRADEDACSEEGLKDVPNVYRKPT